MPREKRAPHGSGIILMAGVGLLMWVVILVTLYLF